MNRRAFLAATGILASAGATRTPSDAARPRPQADATGPVTLLNRNRASELMHRAGLEALVVTTALNVYYVTSAHPVMSRFTQVNMTAALLPADLNRPMAYLGGGFEFYAGVADMGLAAGVELYLTGGSLGDPDSRSNPAFAKVGDYPFDAREQRRRALLDQAAPFHHSMPRALKKALADRSLGRGAIGYDSIDARALLEQASPSSQLQRADDFMLHLRLVKTAAELDLMRRASANNVEAALVTARASRQDGTLRRVRQRFFEEAARRGNIGVYANVDLVMQELADGDLREGQAFMIDFVSHYGFYQGDYGRTVFFGDVDEQIRTATQVGITAWSEIQSRLRPGVKFSDIRRVGAETVRKLGAPFTYAFNPHTVGLQHWDQPRAGLDGKPVDLALEAGMVLSVDCPLLNAGVNGTTHIEDLVLITATGSEPIHLTGHEIIAV